MGCVPVCVCNRNIADSKKRKLRVIGFSFCACACVCLCVSRVIKRAGYDKALTLYASVSTFHLPADHASVGGFKKIKIK